MGCIPCQEKKSLRNQEEPRNNKPCIRTKEFYEDLRVKIQGLNRSDWFSYVNSQINVYNQDCNLFSNFIEENIIPNV